MADVQENLITLQSGPSDHLKNIIHQRQKEDIWWQERRPIKEVYQEKS